MDKLICLNTNQNYISILTLIFNIGINIGAEGLTIDFLIFNITVWLRKSGNTS